LITFWRFSIVPRMVSAVASGPRSCAWTRFRPLDPFDEFVAVLPHRRKLRFVAGRPLQRAFQDLQPLAFVAVRIRLPPR
jgi:hypothetical protein